MKNAILLSLAFAGLATVANASTYTQDNNTYTVSFSSSIPKTYAPTNVIDSSGPVTTTTPDQGYIAGTTYLGLTQSYSGIARSPFEGTSVPSRAYDAVTYGGGDASYATFGEQFTFPGEGTDRIALLSSFSTPFGTGSGSFTFLYGSPDSYNTLQFLDLAGNVITSFTGSQLTNPNTPTGLGYQLTTISAEGFNYSAVRFETTQNSFEFAAVSAVPLPASAPMFGAALLALGAIGYGVKRKKAAAAA